MTEYTHVFTTNQETQRMLEKVTQNKPMVGEFGDSRYKELLRRGKDSSQDLEITS